MAKPINENTRWFKALVALGLALTCGCQRSTPTPEAPHCDPEFAPVRDRVARVVEELGLPGGALLLRIDGQTVCEAYFGAYDEQTAVPVVSAAKWLSAATVLTLVDEGTLALDDPASKYLPYLTGDKVTITVRQLLSHTSGLPPYHECMFDESLTLDECARQIAQVELESPPGTQFRYAGTAYTIAGRVAEAASGMAWEDLFQTRIAEPLNLTATTYGPTKNPVLSEGYTISSLRDYGAFLQMIVNGGTFDSQQVLSPEAIAEMRANQTAEAEIAFSPRGSHTSYGLGVWRDRGGPAEAAGQISSPGGGGFVPWVDFDRNLIGIFMIFHRIEPVWGTVLDIQQQTREIVDNNAAP